MIGEEIPETKLPGAERPGVFSPHSSARLEEVDAVRGMALGGMLLVNLSEFIAVPWLPQLYRSGADWLASLLVLLLAEGKFYPLFAFLFGWGIARRQALGDGSARFFISNLRRMAVLAGFGLLHAALLWEGDILFVYALIGMLLPLLRGAPARLLAALAASMLLLSAFMAMPGPGAELHAAYNEWITPTLGGWLGAPFSNARAGMFPIRFQLAQFACKLAYFPDWLGNFAALILAGYATGAARGIRSRLPLWFMLILALPLNLFYTLASTYAYVLPAAWAGFMRALALSLGGPLLALCYAAWLARRYQTSKKRSVFESLRKIGRMPLTTYIGQSLIGALLLQTLPPETISPALAWLLAGIIFLVQILFASLWLRRHQQGPMEWLWRKLSLAVASRH